MFLSGIPRHGHVGHAAGCTAITANGRILPYRWLSFSREDAYQPMILLSGGVPSKNIEFWPFFADLRPSKATSVPRVDFELVLI